jgi:hypothetical protein
MGILRAGAALGCAILLSMIGVGASNAATIESFDSGWYQSNGFTAGVNNINVGWNPNTGATYRNWLAFDVSGLAGQTITSATLTFYGGNGIYNSADASETLGLFDYTGNVNALTGGQSGAGIYNDLGTGVSYGTATVSGPLQQFSVTLTQAAIAALNAAANNPGDQRFVIGGALLSMALVRDSDNWWNNESLFAIFGPQAALEHAAFLSLEVAPVPLPAALPLFATVLAGGAFVARRRKRKAAKVAA